MPGMRLAVSAIMAALAILPAPRVYSQNVITTGQENSHELKPGIAAVDFVRIQRDAIHPGEFMELNLDRGDSRLVLIHPEDGPWSSVELGELIAGAGAEGGLILDFEPALDQAPWVNRFLFAAGRISGWPAGGPLLIQESDKRFSIIDSPALDNGFLETETAVRLPIGNVNGEPTTGTLSLVQGSWNGHSAAGGFWPDGAMAIHLAQDEDNRRGARTFWDATLAGESRRWRGENPGLLDKFTLGSSQWGVIVPPVLATEATTALGDSKLMTINFMMPPRLRGTLLAVEGDAWLMRGGELVVSSDDDTPRIFSLVATNDDGRLLWICGFGGLDRKEEGLSRREVVEILKKKGASEAMEFEAGRFRLLPELANKDWNAERADIGARMVLGVVAGAPQLHRGDGRIYDRLRVAIAGGHDPAQTWNNAEAIVDGLTRDQHRANQFWAGRVLDSVTFPNPVRQPTPDEMPWIEIALHDPGEVAAIDLYHAERCGFSPVFNLKAFRILGREMAQTDWKVIAEVHHDEPVDVERIWLDPSQRLSSLRLEIIEPNFSWGGRTARLAEMVVWGELPVR